MPRLIRHPKIRRAEILDQAFRIFWSAVEMTPIAAGGSSPGNRTFGNGFTPADRSPLPERPSAWPWLSSFGAWISLKHIHSEEFFSRDILPGLPVASGEVFCRRPHKNYPDSKPDAPSLPRNIRSSDSRQIWLRLPAKGCRRHAVLVFAAQRMSSCRLCRCCRSYPSRWRRTYARRGLSHSGQGLDPPGRAGLFLVSSIRAPC